VSLIGDALKRQQENQTAKVEASDQPPVAKAPPAAPPLLLKSKAGGSAPQAENLEQAPVPHKPAKQRPFMELVLLFIGLIVLVLAGFAVYNWITDNKTGSSPAVSSPKPESPPESARISPESVPTEIGTGKPVEKALAENTPNSVEAETPVDQVASSAVADKAEVTPEQSAASEAQPAAESAKETSIEDVAPREVIWPSISIQAAMGSGGSGPVMIDGKIIRVGESHFGIKIIEVTPRGVMVEYEGEQRLIPVRR